MVRENIWTLIVKNIDVHIVHYIVSSSNFIFRCNTFSWEEYLYAIFILIIFILIICILYLDYIWSYISNLKALVA